MILNIVLCLLTVFLTLLRAYTHGSKKALYFIIYFIVLFSTFYIPFYFFNSKNDNIEFENNILNGQIDKVIKELKQVTDIDLEKEYKKKIVDKKFDLTYLLIPVIVVCLFIIYLGYKYGEKFGYYSYSIMFICLFEFVFDMLVKRVNYTWNDYNIRGRFLENIKKYSNYR